MSPRRQIHFLIVTLAVGLCFAEQSAARTVHCDGISFQLPDTWRVHDTGAGDFTNADGRRSNTTGDSTSLLGTWETLEPDSAANLVVASLPASLPICVADAPAVHREVENHLRRLPGVAAVKLLESASGQVDGRPACSLRFRLLTEDAGSIEQRLCIVQNRQTFVISYTTDGEHPVSAGQFFDTVVSGARVTEPRPPIVGLTRSMSLGVLGCLTCVGLLLRRRTPWSRADVTR